MANKTSKRKTVQKLISFPANMYELLEKKANKRGVLVPEYLRHIVMVDLEEEFDNIPYVSEKTERELAKSLDDIKNGRIYELHFDTDKLEFLPTKNVSNKKRIRS